MKHTMRIITLLLLTMVGAGQAWADSETVGHITYSKGADDHGTLTFHHHYSNANQGSTPITPGQELTPSSNFTESTIKEAVKDANNNIIGYKVYIHAVPDFGYALGDTDVNQYAPVSFIQAEVVTQVQQAPGRRTVEVGEKVEVYKFNNGVYYFTLPADPALSVRVTATFPLKAKNAESISYIGTDGTPQTLSANTAYVLDGTECDYLTLGNPEANSTTWYILNANASYIFINLVGDVNLILANGKGVNVVSNFYGSSHSLAIYGTEGDNDNSGQIIVRGEGFTSFKDLAIYGGQINVSSINANTVTLGWSSASDHIKVNNYYIGESLKVADGQRLVAYNMANATDISATAIVSGTISKPTTIAGKTLKPLDGYYVAIANEHITVSDKTSPDFTISNKPCYVYKASTEQAPVSVTLNYTGEGIVQVTGATLSAVDNKPVQRTFTMPATDVELTATAVTDLTATSVTYDGTARTPEIKQGDDVFDAANYAITYQLDDEAVNAAEVKNVNTYTCTLTGLGQYVGTTTVPFAITKRTTSLAVEIVDPVTTVDGHPVIVAGDDAHVKVTLVPVAGEGETNLPKINGIVKIFVGSKDYTVAIVNGVGHYYVNNLAQDAYDITASFAGDANHDESTSAVTTLEACMILTETTCSVDKTPVDGGDMPMMNVGEAVKVTAELKEVGLQRPVFDSETGKNKEYLYPKADVKPLSIDAAITVILDGSASTVGVTNGTGTITFKKLLVHQDLPPHIDAGDIWRELRDHYVFVAIYAGDDRYVQSESEYVRLKVNRIPITINASVTSPVIAK